MTVPIKSADLQVGDIVHITRGVAGRVDEITGTTDKTITYRFTYTQCDAYPRSVGQTRGNKHLLQTTIEIDARKEAR